MPVNICVVIVVIVMQIKHGKDNDKNSLIKIGSKVKTLSPEHYYNWTFLIWIK